jgi:hypothetical protein
MKVAIEIRTRQEFDELKVVMEIFIVNNRIRELVQSA